MLVWIERCKAAERDRDETLASCQQWSDEADSLRWDRDMIVEERKAAEAEVARLRAALAEVWKHAQSAPRSHALDRIAAICAGAVPPAPPEPPLLDGADPREEVGWAVPPVPQEKP